MIPFHKKMKLHETIKDIIEELFIELNEKDYQKHQMMFLVGSDDVNENVC